MAMSSSGQPTFTRPNYSPQLLELLSPGKHCYYKVDRHPYGKLIELIKTRAVVLLLEHQNPGELHKLKQGMFSLNIVLHSISTMVMAACEIGDFWWPLTGQVRVLKVGKRSFIIALPGLMYGLEFPRTLSEIAINLLQKGFQVFSHYESFSPVAPDLEIEEGSRSFWKMTRERALPTLRVWLAACGLVTGLSPTAVGNQASEVLRSKRMSEAVFSIMKAMLDGYLRPTDCLIYDYRRPDSKSDESYPAISVFTGMIEGQEFLGLLGARQTHLVRPHEMPRECFPEGRKVWLLNQSGFGIVIRLRMQWPTNNPAAQPHQGEANSSHGQPGQA